MLSIIDRKAPYDDHKVINITLTTRTPTDGFKSKTLSIQPLIHYSMSEVLDDAFKKGTLK